MRHAILDRAVQSALAQTRLRSLFNILSYNANAPKAHQRLTLSPQMITARYFVGGNANLILAHWHSGQVRGGDWDQSTRAFDKSIKYGACLKHFRDGTPWHQTQAITYGLKRLAELGKYDACRTEADLIARYENLDGLWAATKAAGCLPDTAHKNTSPTDSILVHIARDGTILFGNKGFHRLAIAKIANVPEITVMVGVVHEDAVVSPIYARLIRDYALV